MGDAENALPPSKKRAAGRELTRDTPLDDDDEGTPELETGTFKRASEEVLATRRIVKVRRQPTNSAPSSNPFAGIRLSSTESGANPAEATTEAQSVSENTIVEETKGSDGIIKDSEEAKNGDLKQSESKTDEAEDKSAANNVASEESTEVKEHPAAESAPESTAVEEQPAEESASDKFEGDKEQSKDGNKNEDEVKKETADADKDIASEVDKKPSKEDDSNDNDDKKANKADGNKNEDEVKKETADADKDIASEVDKKPSKEDDSNDNDDKKANKADGEEPTAEVAPLKSFQLLSSSQNAFTGLAGTGFSTSSFSFGSASSDGSALGSGSGSIFGTNNDKPFSLGFSNNGSSIFGASGASAATKNEGSGFSTMQEVVVETGEENEKVVFNADSILFEFVDGVWKERGKGEVKVNVMTSGTEKARLLMRSRGNYRLILNARLYPDMKLTSMDKRGVTFACINSATEGKNGLSTFALKFKDGSIVEEFRAAVTAHKGETETAHKGEEISTTALKTPENSPKASDD